MMQKNEDVLLEPWIVFHANLFGLKNLFIFDNGSTGSLARNTLKKYCSLGLNVDWSYSRIEDYAAKGEIVGNCISTLDAKSKYDLYIPMDCDEFVILKLAPGRYSAEKELICRYLDALVGEPKVMRVEENLPNVLGSVGKYWTQKYQKTIYAASVFSSTDHGFHTGVSKVENGYRSIDIVYAHYHHCPYPSLKERSREKLRTRVDTSDSEALRKFCGRGWHLVKNLVEDENEYHKRFVAPGAFFFDGLVNAWEDLGVVVLFRDYSLPNAADRGSDNAARPTQPDATLNGDAVAGFDEAFYLSRYPDVAVSVEQGTFRSGLHHYIKYGQRENRSTSNICSVSDK